MPAPPFLRSDADGAKGKETAQGKLRWAEGLRGVAAAIVVNQHWVSGFATELNNGYGPGPAEDMDGGLDHGAGVRWLAWPFLRVAYNGTFTVFLFFVLSGFVLSYKYLSLLHGGVLKTKEGLAHAERTLGSTMLRRFPRLFLPCLAVALISYAILALGGYDRTGEVAYLAAGNQDAWFHRVAPQRDPSSSFLRLFRQTFVSMWITGVNELDSSMWTMSYELRGSVYTLLSALVLGRIGMHGTGKPHWPMLIAGLWCMTPSIYGEYAYFACFFWGVTLAWLDLDARAFPWRAWLRAKFKVDDSNPAWKQRNAYLLEVLPTLALLLSLYLGSFPMRGSSVPWANWMRIIAQFFYAANDPEELVKMWYPIGAGLMVWSILESRALRFVFGNRFFVFLGQISFMLYLIHGPLLWSAASHIFLLILPKTSYDLAVFSTFLIYWTFLIPISWILYWTIDFPANKFCAWMERLLGGDGKIVLEEEVGRGTSANLAYDSSRTMNGGYDSGRVSQRRGDADGESGTTLDEGVRRRKASPESLDVDAVEMEPLYGYGNGTLGRRGEGEGYGYGGWQATPVTATVTPVTSNTYAAVGADGSRVASPYTQTNTPYTQTQSATPYTQSTTPHPQSGNENGHAYQPPQPNPYPPAQTPTTPTITLTAEQYQAYLRLCQTDPEEAGRWYRSMEGYNVAISPV